MSVAKPILDYIDTIPEKPKDLLNQLRVFRRILRYHKPYIHLVVFITALAALRSFLFLLEPLYTSQIIDNVITPGNLAPLLGLLRNILFAVVGFAICDFFIRYLNGIMAQSVIGDMRKEYYQSVQ